MIGCRSCLRGRSRRRVPGRQRSHPAAAGCEREVHHFRKRVEARLIEKVAWDPAGGPENASLTPTSSHP
jgi:hypothetical protein